MGRDAGMAEFIINILVDVVTDIRTLQCLARWRWKKKPAPETVFAQRSD
ncbi:hypothetical protein [Bradyrhizobium mercantei]|nr:hypothetical protein [Bradyrhizobium mercantei]